MKKMFTISALLAAVTAIVIACISDSKEPSAAINKEDSVKAVVDRGEYIAAKAAVCLHCHSKIDINKFSTPVIAGTEGGGAGMPFGKGEGVPGEIFAPNITPFALKDWTDEEIIKALTEGINKKGDTLFPLMPYHNYSRMAADDIQAVVAYLRILKPIDNTTPARKLEIPPGMFGPLPQNTLAQNARPDPSDKIKYGEYLTTMASCSDCHTPMTPQGPDFSKAFAGGFYI
jgi:cytochrome c553